MRRPAKRAPCISHFSYLYFRVLGIRKDKFMSLDGSFLALPTLIFASEHAIRRFCKLRVYLRSASGRDSIGETWRQSGKSGHAAAGGFETAADDGGLPTGAVQNMN